MSIFDYNRKPNDKSNLLFSNTESCFMNQPKANYFLSVHKIRIYNKHKDGNYTCTLTYNTLVDKALQITTSLSPDTDISIDLPINITKFTLSIYLIDLTTNTTTTDTNPAVRSYSYNSVFHPQHKKCIEYIFAIHGVVDNMVDVILLSV